jgi:hypothetical protein
MKVAPNYPKWRAAEEQLDQLIRQKKKRVPSARHSDRMSALYVDAIEGGWNKPIAKISRDTAKDFLSEAANDYSGPYHNRYTRLENIEHDDPELCCALKNWKDRPSPTSSFLQTDSFVFNEIGHPLVTIRVDTCVLRLNKMRVGTKITPAEIAPTENESPRERTYPRITDRSKYSSKKHVTFSHYFG